MKIFSVAVELFHSDTRASGRTDRQTDMTKLQSLFAIFRTRITIRVKYGTHVNIVNTDLYKMFLNPPIPNNVSRTVKGPCILTSFVWTVLCLPCAFTTKLHDVAAKRNNLHNEKLYSQSIIGVCQWNKRSVGRSLSMKLKSLTEPVFIFLIANVTLRTSDNYRVTSRNVSTPSPPLLCEVGQSADWDTSVRQTCWYAEVNNLMSDKIRSL
jgi:hypothetical protein